ncbi:MAG: cytochrome C biogenesis protein [Acidimicrobiia bacterium]|nr:cytochrome C biogenesis protein [Acidimicrobiia bacterium]
MRRPTLADTTPPKTPVLIGAASLCLLVGALYLALTAPPDQQQGEAAKLLFVHVPSIITAYIAYGIGLISAIWYLIRRSMAADRISSSAIEIGVLFTAITLATGMIWGRYVWGVWWDWGDARMISTSVLFFLYLGYLALRRAIQDPRIRAGRCAVLGIVAFVQVPIVHYSVLWMRTLHQGPTIIRPDLANSTVDSEFGLPLGVSILAFLSLLLFLMSARVRVTSLEDDLSRRLGTDQPVGALIVPPRLQGENGG